MVSLKHNAEAKSCIVSLLFFGRCIQTKFTLDSPVNWRVNTLKLLFSIPQSHFSIKKVPPENQEALNEQTNKLE